MNIELYESTDFNVKSGNGIEATVNGAHVVGGNLRFISKYATIPGNLVISYEQLAEKGRTPLFFTKDKEFLGIIAVADAFDAMNSNRCYRTRLSKETILRELEENAGKQFDPLVVKCVMELIEEGKIQVEKEG